MAARRDAQHAAEQIESWQADPVGSRRFCGVREVMSEFYTVAREGDLEDGEARTVRVAGKLVALFRDEGRYYAIDDVCPHMGASLADGYVEQGIVTCPWHAWRFRLADGAWADNPRVKTGCYPVRVNNGEIQVQVPTPPAAGAAEKQT